MHDFVTGIRSTLRPRAGDPHGPLPPLLLALTAVTGMVDAFSYLVLGHVFVANMTGNVVFLAFALVGARGFSITAVVLALGAFAAGALAGGRVARVQNHRARLLGTCTAAQGALVAAGVVVAALQGATLRAPAHDALIAVLGAAMGLQNAAARALAVPDLTTTVLTLTITGLAADSQSARPAGTAAGRRSLSVLVMFAGALVGAACVVHGRRSVDLGAALAVVVAVGAVTRLAGDGDAAWARRAP